jgi:hypothetical protein
VDWIYLPQNRDQWCAVENVGMNLQVPLELGPYYIKCVTVAAQIAKSEYPYRK